MFLSHILCNTPLADGLPPIDDSAPQPLRGQRISMTRRSQGRSRRNTGPRRTSRSARLPSLPHAILRPLSFLLGSWHRRPEEICNALSAPFQIPRGFARPVGSRPADTPQFAPPARWQVREGRTDFQNRRISGCCGAAPQTRGGLRPPSGERPRRRGTMTHASTARYCPRDRDCRLPVLRFGLDRGFGVRGSFVAASSARSENRSSSGSFGVLRQQSRAMRRLR